MNETTQKLTAVIDAIDTYRSYAVTHATSIANDAIHLLDASGRDPAFYPEISEYLRLRNIADAIREEVQP